MGKSAISRICSVFSVICLIIAIVGSSYMAWKFGIVSEEETALGIIRERDWQKTIDYFLRYFFPWFMLYIFWGVVAEHLSRLAWIAEKVSCLDKAERQ